MRVSYGRVIRDCTETYFLCSRSKTIPIIFEFLKNIFKPKDATKKVVEVNLYYEKANKIRF